MPVSVSEEKGIQPSSGGLITAINSYLLKENKQQFNQFFWCGIPGCIISTWIAASKKPIIAPYNYLPVFAPVAEYKAYHNGFANSVIWPLFHYFPSYAEYNAEFYEHYNKVNEYFAEALLKKIRPGDTIWIHDYHLLPLAAILRKEMPEVTIGLFLHIPFPSFEIFRLLPKKWQEDLLKGMLGADLVGFNTIDYSSHFLQSVLMILGLDNDRHVLHFDNRLVKADVFPTSIDYQKFNKAFALEKVVKLREALLQKMNNKKIIFSIDRLDYTKGVHNRLKAFEYFLNHAPQYKGQLVFLLVIVPVKYNTSIYDERKMVIEETIYRINSNMGSDHWKPVRYQYSSPDFEELESMLTACSVALITPLRDGMNLVSKEFVASRQDKKGVLIISEMAGAARELTDALTINPNDIVEMAEKIKEGLEMPDDEQEARIDIMQKRIANYDAQAWASDFMTELTVMKQKQEAFKITFLDEYSKRDIYDKYRTAKKRLLMLDYDGTLVSSSANPEMAIPNPELQQLVTALSEKKENDLYIISGRSSTWLQKYFGDLSVNLIAEHGACYKWRNEAWVTNIQSQNEWKEQVQNLMDIYQRRCANSFIEEKDFSMIWHYGNAHVEQGKLRAYELTSELNEYIRHKHLQVIMGYKTVEVRQSGINKWNFIKKIIEKKDYDYIFAVGDDRTDEEMFKSLIDKPNTFTIKVGADASYAKYNLHTPQMILNILEGMKHLNTPFFTR